MSILIKNMEMPKYSILVCLHSNGIAEIWNPYILEDGEKYQYYEIPNEDEEKIWEFISEN